MSDQTKHIDLVDAHERRQLRQQLTIAREGARLAASKIKRHAEDTLIALERGFEPNTTIIQEVARLEGYTAQMSAIRQMAQQLGIEEVYDDEGWPERN